MSRVFRMKFVPTIYDANKSELSKTDPDTFNQIRKEIFAKFQAYGFIGTGWGNDSSINLQQVSKNQKDIIKKLNSNQSNSLINNFYIMSSLEPGDLIWVIHNSEYYLFKVSENLINKTWPDELETDRKSWYYPKDISTIFIGEWITVGNALNVPGVVINAMSVGSTWMEITKGQALSQRIWNTISKTDFYDIGSFNEEDFWNMLTDRQIEALVLSYIQVEYHCIINSESLKHSTDTYECELIDANGVRYLPQVKSGTASVNVDEYCKKVKAMLPEYKVIPVLFFEQKSYGNYRDKDLITITKSDLMDFIKLKPAFISKAVLEAYKLIK